ncbi:MAG: class I SAM-dependent methyltransferase [Leptospira sp.]|nr:class I SAM-dependent methyltransferase [Leptospira sp.]
MQFFEPYTHFSAIYDQSMQTVAYEKWADYIISMYNSRKSGYPKRILDLGCGTGRLGREIFRLMKARQVQISYVGVDASEGMLEVASRSTKGNDSFTWHHSRMEDFPASREFDLVISTHTTINYLSDLSPFFSKSKSCLIRGGVLFFDFTSKENILRNFHDKEFEESLGDEIMVWKTRFEKARNLIHVELNFHDTKTDELLGTEYHLQYFHEPNEIKRHLARFGFSKIELGGDYKKNPISKKVDMHHYFAIK